MATLFQISTPESFNFMNPEEWPKWIRRFERYRLASSLSNKPTKVQVNALIYHMGNQCRRHTNFLQTVIKRSMTWLKISLRNILSNAKIKSTSEQNSIRGDNSQMNPSMILLRHYYGLVEHCEYGDLHEEMIRDHIVVGLQDASLSEKLQLDPDLTLQKVVTTVQQFETVKKQQATVRRDDFSVDGEILQRQESCAQHSCTSE